MIIEELFIETNKLPKALNKEETYKLLKELAEGNLDAKENLIKHNIRLVLYQVNNRFKTVEYDKKDLVSIGIMGLMKAINTFDLSKNIMFATYATRCIDNEILMFLRKVKRDQSVCSLDKVINNDKDGNEMKLEDIVEADINIENDYTDNETNLILRGLIEKLPEREKEIIKMHFGFYQDKDYTQQEIAKKFNLSQSYVSRIVKKTIKILGSKLEETDIKQFKPEKKKESNYMAKNLQTIYEYFKDYTKEQIDEMLTKLTIEEKELIKLRYGTDLNNPITSKEWNKELYSKFYGSLIPKMKRLLNNPNNEYKSRGRKKNNLQTNNSPKVQTKKELESNINNKEITKEDFIKLYALLKTPYFKKIINSFSIKEAMIATLKFGYVDGKYFSTKSIAEFLDVDIEEVTNTCKNILKAYKVNINKSLDTILKQIDDESSLPEDYTLKLSSKELKEQ